MIIIGITGASGSGKTTLANSLKGHYGNDAEILSEDNYYKDRSDIAKEKRLNLNYDVPAAFDHDLLVHDINLLKKGSTIIPPSYEYSTGTRLPGKQSLKPCKILIVEGILIFSDTRLIELCDLKVYVDSSKDLSLIRRLSRDVTTRNLTLFYTLEKYKSVIRDSYLQYIRPQRSLENITIIKNDLDQQAMDISIITKNIAEILAKNEQDQGNLIFNVYMNFCQ